MRNEPVNKRKPPKRKSGWGKGPRRIAGEALGIPETAEMFFGGSTHTVRGLIRRGQLPYRRLGGRIICLKSELTDFLGSLPGVTAAEARANVEARSC